MVLRKALAVNIIRKIGENAVVLLVSRIFSSVLSFLYMIQIARYLGPDGFGVLCFSLAKNKLKKKAVIC